MSVRKKITLASKILGIALVSGALYAYDTTADQLGWIVDPGLLCGGHYPSSPVVAPFVVEKNDSIAVTSNGGLLSQHATSTLEGNVTVTRGGQQITANKAYLYRDPQTGKLNAIDMIGDVKLREANGLVLGKTGRYNFDSQSKSLLDILYRTSIDSSKIARRKSSRPGITLTAFGRADEFSQTQPKVYELTRATYTTCPPVGLPAWRLKASHIVLDKNTGRGHATNARVEVKNIPVFYFPYINFSIDKQRKSGFLWPLVGGSNQWGPYFLAPFYWNIAPNYDMTITPGILSKRGVQFYDKFRYLTVHNEGTVFFSVLPHDRAFRDFQNGSAINTLYTHPETNSSQTAAVTSAELNRLLSSSDTRKSFYWRDNSQYNEHWSSHVDFNYAGDDYFLRDFGRTLNEISANQLLQEGDLYYKGQNWNFTGRVQTYQTLHPIDQSPVLNQYRRFPQFIVNGDYPDQKGGLEFFVNSEATRFTNLKTPGTPDTLPNGNRLHVQPGISMPRYWSSFYINPRIQLALTDYNLSQTTDTNTPSDEHRALPIADIAAGMSLERSVSLFRYAFQQTLEPQVYYTYIPYRSQSSIPVFDTTVNTLTYDQLFNYNRFTGIDRIGDANQLAWGVTTRLIEQDSGLEKVRLGLGNIIYFANRRVTLCNDISCNDNPANPSNNYSMSPLSGVFSYHINDAWSFNANAIWDLISKQLSNSTLAFQYRPDELHLLNVGYSYARNGDILSGVSTNDSLDNLKVTDVSAAWPIFNTVSVIGRWSQNWNRDHLQNLLYGLQYDTCCWAVRLVGGKAFTGFDPEHNNKPTYNNEVYLQFSLKGLGDIGSGNPGGLLNGIPGYKSQFGQEI
jgi:LPS-assembly protein